MALLTLRKSLVAVALCLAAIVPPTVAWQEDPKPSTGKEPLPGTAPLTIPGEIASHLVDGVDRFLLRELEQSISRREQYWKRDFASPAAYAASVAPNRQRLAHILGVRDSRVADTEPQLIATPSQPALVGKGKNYEIYAIRWPAFAEVTGIGLMLTPTGRAPVADIIAVPDCNVLPEQLVGLLAGVAPPLQYPRRLAENGCRVFVPLLINRQPRVPGLTSREWLYRSAFEMGRDLVGYEVQKVLALVDYCHRLGGGKARIGVIGWGEGGMIALYAAALDERIRAACVCGYFDSRQHLWQEPIDRNVFGLLDQFGDAELASLIAPRALVVEARKGPEAVIPGGKGAPARVVSPTLDAVRAEWERARKLVAGLEPAPEWKLLVDPQNDDGNGQTQTLQTLMDRLAPHIPLVPDGGKPEAKSPESTHLLDVRHAAQVHELDRHSQALLRESYAIRQQATMSRFKYDSLDVYARSAIPVREFFYEEVIGRFPNKVLPFNPRSARRTRRTGGPAMRSCSTSIRTSSRMACCSYPGI